MSVKFDVKSAFVCDDIRREENGLLSFMGVLTDGEFVFKSFPAQARLGVVLVCDVEGIGETKLYPQLRFNGEVKWAGETEIGVDDDGTGIPVCHIVAGFERTGSMDLLLSVGEGVEPSVVKTWDVKALDDLQP
ncbi:hypothetical protein [Brevundimonas goettingensis]|uniref:Uncharacterized protein n=1 Tax=Brevundimonas goettingensis TaxID=2774190 RepID=A0A975C6G0_9CAUL|nr:hypothetical protein [Brevundimonas goettingensis]QTC92850.1 hypothetical protein IFJ75_08410 [Brevundimonas goettingensis]